MAYNIGDKVTIKKALDSGSGCNDYQLHFTPEMQKKFGGKTVTIVDKKNCPAEPVYKYPSDGSYYIIKEDPYYKWTVGMFEPSEKKVVIKIKKQSIKLNYSL